MDDLTYLLALLDMVDLPDPDASPAWWDQHRGDAELVDLLLADGTGQWQALAQARAAVRLPATAADEEVARLARYTLAVLNNAHDLMIVFDDRRLGLLGAGTVWQQQVVQTAFRLLVQARRSNQPG